MEGNRGLVVVAETGCRDGHGGHTAEESGRKETPHWSTSFATDSWCLVILACIPTGRTILPINIKKKGALRLESPLYHFCLVSSSGSKATSHRSRSCSRPGSERRTDCSPARCPRQPRRG